MTTHILKNVLSGSPLAIPRASLIRKLRDNLIARIAKSIAEFKYTYFIDYLCEIMKCQAPEVKTRNKITEDMVPFFRKHMSKGTYLQLVNK